MALQLEVVKTSGRTLGSISIDTLATIKDLKEEISKRWGIAVGRQSLRNGLKGKDQRDDVKLDAIEFVSTNKIFVKDLGPQIAWNTVFFLEYAGPIVLYGLLFLLPHCFYNSEFLSLKSKGQDASNIFPFNFFPIRFINNACYGVTSIKLQNNAYYAGILWTFHYGKRLYETAFIHRFSHGTMPIFNLFKNCGYYWGFAVYVAYHVNHPLHTPPSTLLFLVGTVIFIVCELGNLSCHILLRNLRPEGTNVRKIPVPDSNPLTQLFNYVSCPNYTYEFGSWVGFSILTACSPAFIFALAGLYQMALWAVAKHKKYIAEFPDYPKNRTAIIPFIL